MLHAVPELLDTLEARLIEGEDPTVLLSHIRWSELVGWPVDPESAKALKQRIGAVQALVMGLQSPLRAAIVGMSGSPAYGRNGIPAEGPAITPRLRGKA
jgi:hypothetical protein